MPRHDAVELGERLDLIDDHAAHLRGAVGGLLRQLQDALAIIVQPVIVAQLHAVHAVEPVEGRLRTRKPWVSRRSMAALTGWAQGAGPTSPAPAQSGDQQAGQAPA